MDVSIPCICPGDELRHPDGDTVTLRAKLTFQSAVAVRNALQFAGSDTGFVPGDEALAILSEKYLLYGIESWTLVDDKGKPVSVSSTSITAYLLSNPIVAMDVSDAADVLYSEAVTFPLLKRASQFSLGTPTEPSTSRTTRRSTRRPRPSKPSSISTIPTAVTVTTSSSLDGDSSSSQSSTSAA